jgi:hypothetical protein
MYKDVTQSAKAVFQSQSKALIHPPNLQEVRQDKGRKKSARIATAPPAPLSNPPRPRPLNHTTTRSTNGNAHKRRTVHRTLHLDPEDDAELKRIAAQEGLSVSKVGSAFIHRQLLQHVGLQHSATLVPVLENTIRTELRGMRSSLAWLLVRVAFDSGQIKAVVNNLLSRQPGVSDDVLKNILARAQQLAKGNITRKTPQIKELIEAVEKWLKEGEETHG